MREHRNAIAATLNLSTRWPVTSPGRGTCPAAPSWPADGTFLGDYALAQQLSDRGIDQAGPLGAYCGSGVTATIAIAALAAMGREAALYPGSWSEWSSDPNHPVARGPE